MTMKNRITEAERLQLMGLMLLAHDYSRKLDGIMESAAAIIEEPEFWGTHMGDAFYDYKGNNVNEIEFDKLLKIMGIDVSRDLKDWSAGEQAKQEAS